MPSYEEAVEQALASVAHGGLIHEALEIYHPTFNGQPQRIINAHQEEMFTLESDAPFDAGQTVTFYPVAINARLPNHSLEADPHAIVTFDSAPADLLLAAFNLANSPDPATVVLREYIDTDRTVPFRITKTFLTDPSSSLTTMSAKLRVLNAANKPFPSPNITIEDYASLGS